MGIKSVLEKNLSVSGPNFKDKFVVHNTFPNLTFKVCSCRRCIFTFAARQATMLLEHKKCFVSRKLMKK